MKAPVRWARGRSAILGLILWSAFAAAAPPLEAQALGSRPPHADTLAVRPAARFEVEEGWAALGLVAGSAALAALDLQIAERARAEPLQGSPPLVLGARFFRFAGLPGSVVAAAVLYMIGVTGDAPELARLGLHTGQAIVIAEAVTLTGKLAVGRARPYESPDDAWNVSAGRGLLGDRFQSFPSAHTAAAFAAAGALSAELGERHAEVAVWLAPMLYGGAVLAGASRIYHDEHWASDVAAGALIGAWSGRKTVEFHRSRER